MFPQKLKYLLLKLKPRYKDAVPRILSQQALESRNGRPLPARGDLHHIRSHSATPSTLLAGKASPHQVYLASNSYSSP